MLPPVPVQGDVGLCQLQEEQGGAGEERQAEEEAQGDHHHGQDLPRLQVLVQPRPEVVVDRRDDQVDLEELGGEADGQEHGEEGDQEHLGR